MTRTIYAGRDRLQVPAAWTAFLWHGRRYRLAGPLVECYSESRGGWLPSIRLTTSAPKGRAA